jgi:hypothetical protein
MWRRYEFHPVASREEMEAKTGRLRTMTSSWVNSRDKLTSLTWESLLN